MFGNTTALHRFEDIRRMLRFDSKAMRIARLWKDQIASPRLLLDGVITNSQKCYIHNECLTVDEELYQFTGRCPCIQCMPSKPAKYALKFWMLADAKSYYNFTA